MVLAPLSHPVAGRGRRVALLVLAVAALAALASDAAAQRPRPADPTRIPSVRPATPIALPDALQVALRQSPSISRAVIDIEAARADALAAQGLDDFTLSALASLTRTWTWQTGNSPGAYLQDAAGLGV
ncbi:MAG TPA: hypothetical protein VGD80_12620, partial [Kofleriaceae bacterium]